MSEELEKIEKQFQAARENEALQPLSAEQARWLDLNSHLDELERLASPKERVAVNGSGA
jgi:hypothetical protein